MAESLAPGEICCSRDFGSRAARIGSERGRSAAFAASGLLWRRQMQDVPFLAKFTCATCLIAQAASIDDNNNVDREQATGVRLGPGSAQTVSTANDDFT